MERGKAREEWDETIFGQDKIELVCIWAAFGNLQWSVYDYVCGAEPTDVKKQEKDGGG